MSQHFRFSFLCMAVLAVVIAGCKSNSTGPNSTPSVTVTRPGVGSIFIRRIQQYDSLGHPLSKYDSYDTQVVIASGISYQGKSNVAAFRDGSQPSFANVTYINYEANGDISGYVDGGGSPGARSGWETVPLGSKVSTSFVQYDTSGTGTNGQAWSDKRTDQFTYTGETTISEAGTNFDALVFNYRSMYSGTGYESDAEGTSYFAPSIGYFIKSADVPLANGSTSDLVSYTLK